MKKILFSLTAAASLLAAAVSCAPSFYTLSLDTMAESSLGVDLRGKTISVSYVEDNSRDSLILSNVTDGFAYALESEYFNGEPAVEMFDLKTFPGNKESYGVRDTLATLVLDTDSDVVFLFERPEYIGEPTDPSAQMRFDIYMYDSFGKDRVEHYGARSIVLDTVEEGFAAGTRIAGSFAPTWKQENFTFYYFDSEAWLQPMDKVEALQWKEAMTLWLKLVDTKNYIKRSTAAYDIAVCCYFLNKFDLAKSWLDRSDADYPLANSKSLRSRINAKLEK